MGRYLQKLVEYGFYTFVFLLPWQTRWIWRPGLLNGGAWEYGTFSLYASDIIFLIIVLISLALPGCRWRYLKKQMMLMVIFGFICFVSVLYSQNREVSWYGFIKLLQALALFWLVLRIKFKWRSLGITFVLAGAIQAILGIYQFFTQSVFSNKWLGMAAHNPGVLGDFVVETTGGRFLRAYGSFPHPNMLAGFLVVCLFIIIGFLLRMYMDRQAHLGGIMLAAGVFAVVFFSLILTFSRSACLAFILAFLLAAVISLRQRNKHRFRVLSQAALWILLLTMFSVFLIPEVWQTRASGEGRLEIQSNQERIIYFKQALQYAKGYWYQGVGIGSYTQAVYDQDQSLSAWAYQPVHNIYLLAASEVGIFGGLIFILFIFEFIRGLVGQGWSAMADNHWLLAYTLAFFSLLLIGLFDHYLWSLSFGLLFFWLIFALWTRQKGVLIVDKTGS